MIDLYANAAQTTLAAAITSTSATSATVTSSAAFPAAVTAVSQFRIIIDAEIIIVSNVSGTTWTIVRGAEGTTAATHSNAAPVTCIMTVGATLAIPKVVPAVGQSFKPASGEYMPSSNQQAAGSASVIAVASGSMTYVPFLVQDDQTFDRLAINVGAALVGGTSVVIRVGLYADLGNGLGPGTLIIDGGTVSLASIAMAPATISQLLAPGLYWGAAVLTYSVAPTTLGVYTLGGGAPGLPGGTFTNNYRGRLSTGVSAGALPGTAPSFASAVSNVFAMGLRAA